eukprot:364480-Chlamydomonas_euryale.AAC.23
MSARGFRHGDAASCIRTMRETARETHAGGRGRLAAQLLPLRRRRRRRRSGCRVARTARHDTAAADATVVASPGDLGCIPPQGGQRGAAAGCSPPGLREPSPSFALDRRGGAGHPPRAPPPASRASPSVRAIVRRRHQGVATAPPRPVQTQPGSLGCVTYCTQ